MENASATLGTTVSEVVEPQEKQDTCVESSQQEIAKHYPQPDVTKRAEEDEKIISEAERNLQEKESQEFSHDESTSLEEL